MIDRELLELAAKAIGGLAKLGQEVEWQPENGGAWVSGNGEGWRWAPLANDGDSMRLAVKLRIDITYATEFKDDEMFDVVEVFYSRSGEVGAKRLLHEPLGSDPYAATRRAIIHAAAEIGKAMPS